MSIRVRSRGLVNYSGRSRASAMERFLNGKVALVTGSSRGLGRAIALALAGRGADVCVHCHERWEEVEATRRQVEASGRRSASWVADVADFDQVRSMLIEIERRFGQLDVLVNNAAYVSSHRFPSAEVEVIHRILDVNLKGAFNCILAALELLRASRGIIVNIGALNSRAVSAAGSAYAASKAGLVAMSTNLAHDLGPLGIRINTVAPPLSNTEMGRWAQAEIGTAAPGLGAHQRAADPKEVAAVVALFCSPEFGYVSGETLYMGGGFSAGAAAGFEATSKTPGER